MGFFIGDFMVHKIDTLYISKNKYVPENDPNTEAYLERIRKSKEIKGKANKKKKKCKKNDLIKDMPKKRKTKNKDIFIGTYKNYIKSEVWKHKRYERCKHDNFRCVICEREAVAVHHWFYTMPFGKEEMFQLGSMCGRCHKHIHDEHDDSVKSLAMFKESEAKEMINSLINIIWAEISEIESVIEFKEAIESF